MMDKKSHLKAALIAGFTLLLLVFSLVMLLLSVRGLRRQKYDSI